ncbi:MAG: hypothetical protein OXR62_02490 [Ahrensia sp.]|nr:hypothetical protein [Ahrensia sp.]
MKLPYLLAVIITSRHEVGAVVEIKGGATSRDQIRIGDKAKVEMDLFDTCSKLSEDSWF